MSEDRVTDMEIRMAFLEETVRTLDQVIQELGQSLDNTRRELNDLKETQASHSSDGKDSLSASERMLQDKPPHY